jgi:hypothetical protein
VTDGRVVKYWVNPTTTYGDAFWTSLGSGLVVFLFMYAVLWVGYVLRRVWLRWFWHD